MKALRSILVPLDGSDAAAQVLGCAAWLADRASAHLHLLSAADHERPARDELARLQVPERLWPKVVLHQTTGYAERDILKAIGMHDVQLVAMAAHGASPRTEGVVGHVTRTVIERSPVPVLVLPTEYTERLPWTRAVVPVSGTLEADDALTFAVRLAGILDLDIVAAHVADPGAGNDGLEAAARYADAPHHEYPQQFEEFVRRALPHCTADECRRITGLVLCHGSILAELLNLVEQRSTDLLVLGWDAGLGDHRHTLVAALIDKLHCPLLLVKAATRTPFRLKVGEDGA